MHAHVLMCNVRKELILLVSLGMVVTSSGAFFAEKKNRTSHEANPRDRNLTVLMCTLGFSSETAKSRAQT